MHSSKPSLKHLSTDTHGDRQKCFSSVTGQLQSKKKPLHSANVSRSGTHILRVCGAQSWDPSLPNEAFSLYGYAEPYRTPQDHRINTCASNIGGYCQASCCPGRQIQPQQRAQGYGWGSATWARDHYKVRGDLGRQGQGQAGLGNVGVSRPSILLSKRYFKKLRDADFTSCQGTMHILLLARKRQRPLDLHFHRRTGPGFRMQDRGRGRHRSKPSRTAR